MEAEHPRRSQCDGHVGHAVEALKARVDSSPAAFTLIVPATPGGGRRGRPGHARRGARAAAGRRARGRRERGRRDPLVAVTEAWDPKRYDEIIVSTLPMRFSKWLHAGLPERSAS